MTKKIIIIHISAFTNIVCVVHKINVGIVVPEITQIFVILAGITLKTHKNGKEIEEK